MIRIVAISVFFLFSQPDWASDASCAENIQPSGIENVVAAIFRRDLDEVGTYRLTVTTKQFVVADFLELQKAVNAMHVTLNIQSIVALGLDVQINLGIEGRGRDIIQAFIFLKDRSKTGLISRIQWSHNEQLVVLLDKPITQLKLPVRIQNGLLNENVAYIGELVQKSEDELGRIPNVGRVSIAATNRVLAGLGLYLGMPLRGWRRPDLPR